MVEVVLSVGSCWCAGVVVNPAGLDLDFPDYFCSWFQKVAMNFCDFFFRMVGVLLTSDLY